MKAIRESGFVVSGGNKRKPLSNMAMLAVLKRMDRGQLTAHGFRSSFRDWAAERTKFPHEVTEMALATQSATRSRQHTPAATCSRSAGS